MGDTPQVTALGDAVRAVDAADRPQRILESLLEATVFLEAPQRPGVMTLQTPAGPLTAVFSDLQLLAEQRGPVPWFSTTGADLLAQAPDIDLLLDPGSAHSVVLRTSRLKRAVRVDHAEGGRTEVGGGRG